MSKEIEIVDAEVTELPTVSAMTALAVTKAKAEAQFFEEELQILNILMRRLFRVAIGSDAPEELLTMPEVEDEEMTAKLDEALAELDEARDGADSVKRELTKWREELVGG